MTDLQLQQIYQAGLNTSHLAALKTVFAAGYAAHAGTVIGQGNPSKSATALTASQIPVILNPNDSDHG
jgi:hypothetical protein